MLTSPIPLQLFNDPKVAYTQMTEGLQPGDRVSLPFDFTIKELPGLTRVDYLESAFPASPLLSADLDMDSWEWRQSALASCGHFAAVCSYASIPRHLAIALERGIYPTQKSPYGLYFIRIAVDGGTKWMAIDSRYTLDSNGKLGFCKMMVEAAPFAPQLFFKSRAVARGGGWDTITNSNTLSLDFAGWFPNVKEQITTFEQFKERFDRGTLAGFTFAQQYDVAGNKITPSGVFYAHAYAICDYLESGDHKLVRVQNPHNTGAEPNWSAYGDDSAFWRDRPELADKLQSSKISGGNFWLSWDELIKRCSGGTVTTRTWTGTL